MSDQPFVYQGPEEKRHWLDRPVSTDTEVLAANARLWSLVMPYRRHRRTDYPMYVWHRGWSYRIDWPQGTRASVQKYHRHAKRPNGRRRV